MKHILESNKINSIYSSTFVKSRKLLFVLEIDNDPFESNRNARILAYHTELFQLKGSFALSVVKTGLVSNSQTSS